MFGEPFHELYGTTGKLRQFLGNMEIERVIRVDAHRGECLIVVERLFKFLEQRIVVTLPIILHFLVRFADLHIVVDDTQLFGLLHLVFLLQLGDGFQIRHRHEFALVNHFAEVHGVEIIVGGNGIPLQRDIEQCQDKRQSQKESCGATLVDISLWSLFLFHVSGNKMRITTLLFMRYR